MGPSIEAAVGLLEEGKDEDEDEDEDLIDDSRHRKVVVLIPGEALSHEAHSDARHAVPAAKRLFEESHRDDISSTSQEQKEDPEDAADSGQAGYDNASVPALLLSPGASMPVVAPPVPMACRPVADFDAPPLLTAEGEAAAMMAIGAAMLAAPEGLRAMRMQGQGTHHGVDEDSPPGAAEAILGVPASLFPAGPHAGASELMGLPAALPRGVAVARAMRWEEDGGGGSGRVGAGGAGGQSAHALLGLLGDTPGGGHNVTGTGRGEPVVRCRVELPVGMVAGVARLGPALESTSLKALNEEAVRIVNRDADSGQDPTRVASAKGRARAIEQQRTRVAAAAFAASGPAWTVASQAAASFPIGALSSSGEAGEREAVAVDSLSGDGSGDRLDAPEDPRVQFGHAVGVRGPQAPPARKALRRLEAAFLRVLATAFPSHTRSSHSRRQRARLDGLRRLRALETDVCRVLSQRLVDAAASLHSVVGVAKGESQSARGTSYSHRRNKRLHPHGDDRGVSLAEAAEDGMKLLRRRQIAGSVAPVGGAFDDEGGESDDDLSGHDRRDKPFSSSVGSYGAAGEVLPGTGSRGESLVVAAASEGSRRVAAPLAAILDGEDA